MTAGMRTILLALGGLATLTLAWSDLPATLLTGPFASHMLSHMLLVAVAAPLLAVALARSTPHLGSRLATWCPPVPASLLELLLVWAWHAPLLHHAARTSGAAWLAEQAAFLLVGFCLWATAFARDPKGRLARAPEGILALLLTATHMTLLGVLLTLAPRSLFTSGHSAIADQHLGGIIMLTIGGLAYLGGGLALLGEILHVPAPPRQREDRCA